MIVWACRRAVTIDIHVCILATVALTMQIHRTLNVATVSVTRVVAGARTEPSGKLLRAGAGLCSGTSAYFQTHVEDVLACLLPLVDSAKILRKVIGMD